MWGLEYALFFGVPDNKIELIDGRSRWAFPFASRELAEQHFSAWLAVLSRWKECEEPPVRKKGTTWRTEARGVKMRLYPRPIEFRFPMDWEAFDAFLHTFWDPRMWPGDKAQGRKYGFLANLDHQDVQHNLWGLFDGICHRHGGNHSSRVDIALSDSAAVSPDLYYFGKSRRECMIEGDYFCGIPDLVAEVLSPASRAIDRGARMELYRRSGVPHLWLLDPDSETVETYELVDKHYCLRATHRAGESFQPVLFPGEVVEVDSLFRTQSKRHGDRCGPQELPPIPEWLIAPEKKLGLEYFFLLGHPERRWEIWGNRAPSVLAFGSPAEANARLQHFLQEACRWEEKDKAATTMMSDDIEQAEVGRFKFTRSGRHVHLDVAVDARKYRELLQIWTRRDAWDWGEK